MNFWKCNAQPEKFCLTTGTVAMMITHKSDEIKIISRPLHAGYAANIKSRYKPDSIENYPLIKDLIHLLTSKS